MAINRLNPDYPDAGLVQVVPTSVTVGSGSGSVDGNGAVTFSGASSVSLNNCFTSTYDNYHIKVLVTTSGNATVSSRLRASGSDITTANYNTRGFYVGFSSALSRVVTSGSTAWDILGLNANKGLFNFEISQPNAAATKINFVKCYSQSSGDQVDYEIDFSASTVADGFSIYVNTGTITGTVRVYGYRN